MPLITYDTAYEIEDLNQHRRITSRMFSVNESNGCYRSEQLDDVMHDINTIWNRMREFKDSRLSNIIDNLGNAIDDLQLLMQP